VKKKSEVILIGGGMFANEIYDLFSSEIPDRIVGYCDDKKKCFLANQNRTLKYFGKLLSNDLDRNYKIHIASGDWKLRHRLYKHYKELGFEFYSFIHPSSVITKSATISNGCYVGPNAIISSNSILEENIVLNCFSGIGHDCTIGKNTIISPKVMINGGCKIDESVFFGSNSVVFQNVSIGKFSTIDSGYILRKNLDDFSIAANKMESNSIADKIKKSYWESSNK